MSPEDKRAQICKVPTKIENSNFPDQVPRGWLSIQVGGYKSRGKSQPASHAAHTHVWPQGAIKSTLLGNWNRLQPSALIWTRGWTGPGTSSAAPWMLDYCHPVLFCCLVAQLCLNLFDSMDCSLPGSSVHGIIQAKILEWVAISFARGSSQPRDRIQVSCIAGRCFNLWATSEAV